MTKQKNNSPDDLHSAIHKMLAEGSVMAYCPLCTFPISIIEFENHSCDKCGDINPDQILIKSTENIIYS